MPCGNILVRQPCSYIKHDDGTLTMNAANESKCKSNDVSKLSKKSLNHHKSTIILRTTTSLLVQKLVSNSPLKVF